MLTNASDTRIAAQLSALTAEDQGTLLTALVHKMGDERGATGAKVVYGDDTVHVLVWTGFSYKALIERSDKKLKQILNRGGLILKLAREAWNENPETTVEDACLAIQEMQDWFRRVLADTAVNGERVPDPDDLPPLWKPLEVDGVKVRGARVYNGPERPGDERAPKPGTIYVQGVKLGEVVVRPAKNGEWKVKSKPKTIAKRILQEKLPVGLFVQYKLDPERCMDVKVGSGASQSAKDADIPINPEALRSLFKVAP